MKKYLELKARNTIIMNDVTPLQDMLTNGELEDGCDELVALNGLLSEYNDNVKLMTELIG